MIFLAIVYCLHNISKQNMFPYNGLSRSPSQNRLLPIEIKKCVKCNHQELLETDTDWGFFVDLETYQWVQHMRHSRYNYGIKSPYFINTINEDDEYMWDNNDKPHRKSKNMRTYSYLYWKEICSVLKNTNTGIMIVLNIKGIFATATCMFLTLGTIMMIDKYIN